MIFGVFAIILLAHVALGFALGRTASIRAFILEAGGIMGIGLLVLVGWIPGFTEGATAEGLMGLYGVVGAGLPFVGLAYAAGVVLRWPLRLPKEGFLWRVKGARGSAPSTPESSPASVPPEAGV